MLRKRRLAQAIGLVLISVLGTGGWAVENVQKAVTTPPPGAAAWRADHSLSRSLPDPATASPAAVARFFASLTDAQQRGLARRHPLTVGNLDGAPISLRYRANFLAIKAEKAALERSDPTARQEGQSAARYADLLRPGRQILAFDPRGRGQIAEVYGNLETARRTAVVVPGSDIDLGSFDRAKDPYGTPSRMAQTLHAKMAENAPATPTAVIAWAGYTTPVGLGPDAATGRLAEAGAPRLNRFLAGLKATGAAAPTVLCHSYGSVLCGVAAPAMSPGTASDLVFLASPGTRTDTAAELGTTARVWAARDATDWIGDVPHLRLLGLGHGADPTDPAYGARRVSADRAEGHTGYFAPGTDSLDNFADITLGAYSAVRCAADDQECRHDLG
ncbi:alpha/beta hydrolase [Streptomyces sp. NPDC101150]|uniref:alpha/beta hydrolase n=1 Tax=Streptomyces sp. NPDC101150 TaxID=3366114 RepID=UPI00382513A8